MHFNAQHNVYLWTIAGVCTGEWWHWGGEEKQTLLFRGIPDLYLHLRSYYSPLFSFFCHEMNGPLLTDLLSQILSSHRRRSPSPSLHPPFSQPTPLAFIAALLPYFSNTWHIDVIPTKTPSRPSAITPAVAVAVADTQEGESMRQCQSSMLRFY